MLCAYALIYKVNNLTISMFYLQGHAVEKTFVVRKYGNYTAFTLSNDSSLSP